MSVAEVLLIVQTSSCKTLASTIAALDVGKHMDFMERMGLIIDSDVLLRLKKAFSDVLAKEVSYALNAESIEVLRERYPYLVENFLSRIYFPLFQVSNRLLKQLSTDKDFEEIYLKLVKSVAEDLRRTNYKYSEDLIYALSLLADRDLWLVRRVSEMGLDIFVKKLVKRGLRESLEATSYMLYAMFSWISASSAVLGLVDRFKWNNVDVLTKWSRHYAEELDIYIDTLDTILDDEVYGNLKSLGLNVEG